jgi:anti-sigma regulatory factor (Ser/Thr protein kinase)
VGEKSIAQHYSARFTSSPESLRSARDAVRVFAATCGFGEIEAADVVFAVGEAVANAVEHGSAPGVFTLACRFSGDALTVEIADGGRGFAEWHKVQAARSGFRAEATPPGTTPLRGYGIRIMYEMMDEVSYHDGGRRVRLLKRRAHIKSKSEEGSGTDERI